MNLKRKGMASVESLMLIAVGAAILMGLTQYWQTQLAPQTKNLIAQVLGEERDELPEAGFDTNRHLPNANTGLGSNSDGSSVPQDVEPQDQENGGDVSSDSDFVDPQPDDGEITPVGEDTVRDFIAETIKQGANDYADAAVETATEELENFLPSQLPLGVELDLDDWDLKKAELNQSLVKNIGIVTGAISAVDGLTQAEQRVKDLADEGKYREAFGTIFSGSSGFITDTILSSKAAGAVLDKLPSSVQVAIQSTIPNAVASVTQAAGEKVFDSVGKKINDKLWSWYDRGYLPRKPRIPRDYGF